MIKKVSIFAVAVAIVLAVVPSVQAKGNVGVVLDGRALVFNQTPFEEEGTTLAEFRTVFKALGYDVSWDAGTRTVSATKSGMEITLQIGSKTATVNGKSETLAIAPMTLNGLTFVPLRWIAEVSGGDVTWDGVKHVVSIETPDYQLRQLVIRYYSALQSEDEAAVLSEVQAGTPLADMLQKTLRQQFEANDLSYQVTGWNVLSVAAGEAAAQARIETGSEKDGQKTVLNDSTNALSFVKVDGVWKLVKNNMVSVSYPVGEKYEPGQVDLSEQEQQAVVAFVKSRDALIDQENADGLNALYASDYPGLADEMKQQKQIFSLYDLKAETSDVKILRADADQAIVQYDLTIHFDGAASSHDNVQTHVDTLKKIGGSWKIAASDSLSFRYLSPPQ